MSMDDFSADIENNGNKVREKLINTIYSASDEELSFYDRLITFSQDERAEFKKNLTLKRIINT